MKKILPLFIIAALMLTIFVGASGTALADDKYSIKVTPDGVSVSSGQSVSFSASISNNSGSDLTGYSIQSGDTVYYSPDGPLANGSGASSVKLKALTVTDSMISDGFIKFYLCSSSGEHLASCSVSISNGSGSGGSSGEAKIGVTVTPNSTKANLYKSGDVITFTFKIENQGSVAVSDVTVKNGSKKVTTPIASISPGNSQTVTYDYTFTKAATLNFTVVYTANGQALTKALDPISLGVENRDVKATITVDNKKPNPGETVTFSLEIKNNGNVPYTKMTVDWNGQSLKSPSSTLNGGDDFKKDYPMSFDVSEDVQLTITMYDQKGNKVSVPTNPISINLPIDKEALNAGVTFSVKPDRKEMTSDGTINFSGYVSNMSIYDLTGVTVSDPASGEIFSDDIAAGKSEAINKAVDIKATTTYNFVLSYKDRDGNPYSAKCDPITVKILEADDDSPSASPTGTADVSNVSLTPAKTGGDPLLIWIIVAIVLVVLIIGVGVMLIILWKQGNMPVKAAAGGKPSPSLKPVKHTKPVKPSKPSISRGKGPVKGGFGKPKKGFRDRNHF